MPSCLRITLRHLLVVSVFISAACQTTAAEKTSITIAEKPTPGTLARVQVAVEVTGQLKLNADGKQVTRLPLTGKGELAYDEKLLEPANPSSKRAARFYRRASSISRVGEADVTTSLGEDHRLILAHAGPTKVVLASPAEPLTADELQLIDVQASSLLLSRLLPDKEIAIGEKWNHDEALAACLLGLDVVTHSSLESTLARIQDNTAYLEMSGTVSGSVDGVASEIEVTAKYNFDTTQHRIVWLAMSIKEKRDVGHAEPGFDVTARIRISVEPLESSDELNDAILNQLPLESPTFDWQTFVSSAGGFQLVHDQKWHVMVDRKDVTILRFIERGELVAQCNISRLADAAAGKQLSMKSFQADIQRVLDKNFHKFVDAGESKSEKGLRVLKTVVSGVASELPIQWSYYHLTDEQGRQVSLVFTMDAKLVERFGGADQVLVESLKILAVDAPTAAKEARVTGVESGKRR